MRNVLVMALTLLGAGSANCAPPPPFNAARMQLEHSVVMAFVAGDASSLAAMMAPDAKVTLNGKLIASGSKVALFLSRDFSNVTHTPILVSYGDELAISESLFSKGGGEGAKAVQDCCGWARSIRVLFNANGRIASLDVLEVRGSWERGPGFKGLAE